MQRARRVKGSPVLASATTVPQNLIFHESRGLTKDAANLFVAGPDLFPAEGGVNQTFFLHALTSRTGK